MTRMLTVVLCSDRLNQHFVQLLRLTDSYLQRIFRSQLFFLWRALHCTGPGLAFELGRIVRLIETSGATAKTAMIAHGFQDKASNANG